MSEDRITYSDVEEYETLFTIAPAFIIEKFAKRNSNLVSKFKPIIQGYMDSLTDEQKHKLDLILKTDIDELQSIMAESYRKTGKNQFKVLANSQYKDFIKENLDEIRSMI